ncbi:hypothetical protein J2T57_001491 [Natronocella acetinitrilica]|uniref:Uncharacterized protein n=1 Tax=Natronocella acetinitrilica TaxID=414046 RepID=A0AAE3KB53_9GAMM|nr:hypothetical protein [Natronocella acetinitrilica]MCP1674389.1 hypothetical protein [Natronocella acetinitrilica]
MAKDYRNNFGELAYNDANKQRFLRETRALLRRVAARLTASGVAAEASVRVNKGGIAVGGDVYLDVALPGGQSGVLLTVTHASFSPRRPDGVVAYAQFRGAERHRALSRSARGPWRTRIIGSNVTPREIDEDTLVSCCAEMLRLHPERHVACEAEACAAPAP